MLRSLATKSLSSFKTASTRSFHSPFAVLGSQMTTTPPPSSQANPGWYEKQSDFSHEPIPSHTGQNMYVVSEPDPANTHYQVPSGAYPTSAPYINFAPTEAPNTHGMQYSSTGNGFAHPVTTKAASQHHEGVGFSSAKGAPDLMDKEGTKAGIGELASRNPQPDSSVAAEYSKLGVGKASAARK